MSQSPEMQNLIKNLEMWRADHDMSQGAFAKAIKMSPSTYNKLLAGQISSISADTIKAIYKLTGKMCFQLMESCDDVYLRLLDKLHKMSEQELIYMNQFVDVYLEAKRRMKDETGKTSIGIVPGAKTDKRKKGVAGVRPQTDQT